MKFWAILRDSYREAVDGFVIYVMLALAAVLIAVLASVSFTPVAAEKAVPHVVEQQFLMYIPDRGKSTALGAAAGVEYKAADFRTEGKDVGFKLTAKGGKGQVTDDGFRDAVAGWMKPVGKTKKFRLPKGAAKGGEPDPAEVKDLEFALKPDIDPAEAAAVTPADMVAFLTSQFATHFGTDRVTIRPAAGSADKTHAFDVEMHGGTACKAWPQTLGFGFGAWELGETPLGFALYVIEDRIVNGAGAAVTLLISVIITAFFIPNLLRKGSLDLIVAKPIGRAQLLIYKYLGGLTFMFLLTAFTVGGAWLVLSARSGFWEPRFLLVIPALTFTFAILYAVSTLVAVLTRSAIAAILLTLGFAFLLYLLGQVKSVADLQRNTGVNVFGVWPDWLYSGVDGLSAAVPPYKGMDKVTSKLTAEGTLTPIFIRFQEAIYDDPDWGPTIGLSLLYIAAFLGLACWRLVTRDG